MAAWDDLEVQRAAELLVELNRRFLLLFAIQQLTVDARSGSPMSAGLRRLLDVLRIAETDPARGQARELMQLCFRIATNTTGPRATDWPGLRRGALLERLIAGLLGVRPLVVHHETRISADGWESKCQDVVGVPPGAADQPFMEVYEGKTDVADLEDEPGELAEISRRTEHLGTPVVAVATLMTNDYVDALLAGVAIPSVVRRVTQETILALAVRPPTVPLGSAA